jgi:hypothetical protein
MNLVLHILRKDLRRHRWEILLFLLACAGWAWQVGHAAGWLAERLRPFAPIVFFGMWFLLTVRVVQGESLVGDREFWSTRPYRWHQLLAAKAWFLLLCLNLPLLVAQVALLKAAGIPLSWSLVPGLLFLQLWLAFFITFPAVTLATLTESLVQWILALVGLLAFALVVTWLPWNRLPTTLEGQENVAGLIGIGLIVPILAFALLWQYVRRRAWPARLAACTAVLLVPLVVLIAPTHGIFSLAYMHPEGAVPVHLSIQEGSSGSGRTYTRYEREYNPGPEISIPVVASATDPDTLIDLDGWRITLTGDNGWRWQSPWINHTFWFGGDATATSVSFDMPAAAADLLAQKHAKALVELAFSVFRLAPPRRIETTGRQFTLPGGIICHGNPEESGLLTFVGTGCVAPLHLPEVMITQMESGESTCPTRTGSQPLPPGHRAVGINFGTSLPAEFDPNPARSFYPTLNGWYPPIPLAPGSRENLPAKFCRGTPLTVRTGTSMGKMQTAFDLGSIGSEVRGVEPSDDE